MSTTKETKAQRKEGRRFAHRVLPIGTMIRNLRKGMMGWDFEASADGKKWWECSSFDTPE